MTPFEVTILAVRRLTHEWEMSGSSANLVPAIRRIAGEVARTQPHVRHDVEAHLHDEWARLLAQEGDNDDYAV